MAQIGGRSSTQAITGAQSLKLPALWARKDAAAFSFRIKKEQIPEFFRVAKLMIEPDSSDVEKCRAVYFASLDMGWVEDLGISENSEMLNLFFLVIISLVNKAEALCDN